MSFVLVEKRPADCMPAELTAFCDLVKRGDEVDPEGLEGRVERAWLLAFGSVDGSLVAVGGIKRPDKGYRAGVFRKSGCGLEPTKFPIELGWVMVDEGFRRRGHGRRLIESLLRSLNNSVYTTSRTTNEDMHGLLGACGFEQAGGAWKSERGAYQLLLHVKQWKEGK
jgi:GNAT superfamily N-acetyltransferase